ncbi:DUF4876 domain-containing protein [Aestuariibaculum lutulentum]|uniref:DUF4876 domain-containing protein n=1 Tax=Aestuariibaculum lutulentum TaxID=2920935 RepID=A0ABS9RHC7_9FLAO|nr:DUF4876 domain-containing protein [Aestuariibaculum lutulentum]MCH4552351.1 DUF4876 domain-containing protein [Aestuariibaculum lutulentum]
MKKILLFVLTSFLMACSNDDDNFVMPVNNSFKVTFNEGYDFAAAANVAITLVNNDDGKTYTLTTDANGMADIEVVPGKYNVNASLVFTAEEYSAYWGQEVSDPVSFNASLSGVTINQESTGLVEMVLVSGKIGSLLIKQVYFSGSDVKLGASFRDLFFEVYNNSNEAVYLDGLCFAQVYGASSVSSTLQSYHLANGQYDWSQSYNQANVEHANTNYVYADEVLRFPGTGEEHLLEPRKSVIVAATAINHKSPLTVLDNDGETKVYEVPEPDRTIDLSNAPFEAYYRDYQESIGSSYLDSDIDNPNAANMEIVFKTYAGKDLILDPFGRDAFVLFKENDDAINSWGRVPLPSIAAENYSEDTKVYLQIPSAVIIDGVETQRNDPSKAKPKRLTDDIDAGEISTILGHYSSESVIRKSKEVNGITVYQDTNNSSNDFMVLSHPEVIIE